MDQDNNLITPISFAELLSVSDLDSLTLKRRLTPLVAKGAISYTGLATVRYGIPEHILPSILSSDVAVPQMIEPELIIDFSDQDSLDDIVISESTDLAVFIPSTVTLKQRERMLDVQKIESYIQSRTLNLDAFLHGLKPKSPRDIAIYFYNMKGTDFLYKQFQDAVKSYFRGVSKRDIKGLYNACRVADYFEKGKVTKLSWNDITKYYNSMSISLRRYIHEQTRNITDANMGAHERAKNFITYSFIDPDKKMDVIEVLTLLPASYIEVFYAGNVKLYKMAKAKAAGNKSSAENADRKQLPSLATPTYQEDTSVDGYVRKAERILRGEVEDYKKKGYATLTSLINDKEAGNKPFLTRLYTDIIKEERLIGAVEVDEKQVMVYVNLTDKSVVSKYIDNILQQNRDGKDN
ncbi:hypothetical protein ACFL0W_00715 [Nanoarchaeota archaeon]